MIVSGESALLAGVEIEDPETLQRRLRLARTYGELLLGAQAIIAVDRIRRDEVNLSTVGAELPRAHAGRMTRQLRRAGDVSPQVGDGEGVDLFVALAAGRVDNRLPVLGEREIRYAFAPISPPLGLAAVESHDVELVARIAAWRGCTAPAARRSRGPGRCIAIGEKRDEGSVARPFG